MDQDTFSKAICVEGNPEYIRMCSVLPYTINNVLGRVSGERQVWVYRKYKPLHYPALDDWIFMFSHVEKDIDYPMPSEEERFDDGFSEPDENVNLDKLSGKLRDNKDMKKRLLRYFRK